MRINNSFKKWKSKRHLWVLLKRYYSIIREYETFIDKSSHLLNQSRLNDVMYRFINYLIYSKLVNKDEIQNS